ncbi:MAG: MFS transporter [Epulopiscium sp.]|nr:MFS transporter [Candidatus Epulonipiscium sp.]
MRGLSKKERSWVLYDWANSAYSMTVTSTILPLYFKNAVHSSGVSEATSTAYWGYANSIATLLLALLAPILGTIADYKGYKKKFFTTFFMLGVICTALLGVIPSDYWMLLLIFYVITTIGFSGANVFYDAFLVDVTEEERMHKVSTDGFAWGYIGSTIPFIICMALIILAQKNIIPLSVTNASRLSFVITALWWGAFTIPMMKNVHQIFGLEPEDQIVIKSFKRLGNTMKNIKKHKPLFLFLLAYFFYIDGVGTIIKMATSYGYDLGIGATDLLIVLLATQFVAFPCTIIYGKLAQKYGAKKMISVGIITYILICIYAIFLKTTLDFWILAMLVGTAQGGIQALSRSYYGKLVPKENANEFFGFYDIFGKFAAVMGPTLLGLVAQITGKTNLGVFSVIILFIIGAVIFKFVPGVEESKGV